MANAAAIHPSSRWIVGFSVVAILCGLTAHLIADAAFGALGLDQPGYCATNHRFNSPPAVCDLMADSLLPAMIDIAYGPPGKTRLNSLNPNRLVWFPLRLIHPPIELL